MSTFRNITREIQSLGQQRRAQLKVAAMPNELALSDQGLTLRNGARVLDLVTGEEGFILDGKSEHIVTSAA